MPIFVAPMAMQCMAHPDGELAVSRACSAVSTCMVRQQGSMHQPFHAIPRVGSTALCATTSPDIDMTMAVTCIGHCDGKSPGLATFAHPRLQGVSTMATSTLEDVAASADPGTLFFQLYVLRDRDVTRNIVQVSGLVEFDVVEQFAGNFGLGDDRYNISQSEFDTCREQRRQVMQRWQ